jgi:hypothetical protein
MTNQVETNETVLDNASVLDLGKRAFEYFRTADRDGAKGEAMATYCLWIAHNTMTFEADVTDRKGNIVETLRFDLAEANPHSSGYVDLRNEDGSRNIKGIAARNAAIAKRVFGIEELSNADKTRIARCLKLVAFFQRSGLEMEAVKLSKRNELIVPYEVMNAEPDEKATTNERTVYERMVGTDHAIDGKHGNSLSELHRRANPPKERSAQSPDNDAQRAVSFFNSVKMVTAIITARNDENGDDKAADGIPAFGGELKANLWNLYQQLGSYFEADPIEEEEEEKKDGTNG